MFKDNLRKFREQAGYLSAKDFAKLLGVPYPKYMSYENKGSEPRYDLLAKIATTLNVSTDDLLGIDQSKYKYADLIHILNRTDCKVEIADNDIKLFWKQHEVTIDDNQFADFNAYYKERIDETNKQLLSAVKSFLIGVFIRNQTDSDTDQLIAEINASDDKFKITTVTIPIKIMPRNSPSTDALEKSLQADALIK